MTWRIARKELLGNLITLRFSMCTALFLALVVLFTSVLISDYRQKLDHYNERVARNSERLRNQMTYKNLKPDIYKPPEVLSVFSKGLEDNISKEVQIIINAVPVPKGAYTAKNPLLSVFPVLDIVLIFKLVISILIFLFIYDTISGEKEDRTLALMLANCIPRHQILFGKFIGALITISIPITIGFLTTGLILLLSPVVDLTSSEWFLIVLMYFVSVIMVGVLCSIGLFFSAITRQASQTMIFLFSVWVLLAFIIPNSSMYLASWLKPIEPQRTIDLQASEVQGEFRNRTRELMANNPPSGYHIQSDTTEPGGYYHKFASKSLIRDRQKLYSVAIPIAIEYADKELQVRKSYLESMKRQENLAAKISLLSPLSVYEMLISRLSGTNAVNFERFYEQAGDYRRQIIEYLYSKKAFSSIRYFATVKEEHLFDVKNVEEYSALREKYANNNPEPLNLKDLPRFTYRPGIITDTVKGILPNLGLLFLTGALFFVCAFVAFLKYDVR